MTLIKLSRRHQPEETTDRRYLDWLADNPNGYILLKMPGLRTGGRSLSARSRTVV